MNFKDPCCSRFFLTVSLISLLGITACAPEKVEPHGKKPKPFLDYLSLDPSRDHEYISGILAKSHIMVSFSEFIADTSGDEITFFLVETESKFQFLDMQGLIVEEKEFSQMLRRPNQQISTYFICFSAKLNMTAERFVHLLQLFAENNVNEKPLLLVICLRP